jgi:8-oxo-dGTP diphosphatase
MRDFIESKLKEITEKVKNEKKIKTEYGGLNNQFKTEKEHSNLRINTDNNFIKSESIIREIKEKTNKNMFVSLTVIFNNENKILLLKRSEDTNWCPNCWALVGGKIEKGEAPEDGLIREVFEETKKELIKFKFKKIIKENNVIQYLYLSKVDDDFVELNGEHSDYGWYTIDQIKKMDNKVPNLINYIKNVII